MTDILLDYIIEVEATNLHRNSTEDDITSPGGIYRSAHPNASIWAYIDDVGALLGKDADSSKWSSTDIQDVDRSLDKSTIRRELSNFYDSYLEDAHLDLFDEQLKIAMFNIYTNTPTGAWKAVQQTIIDIKKMGLIDIDDSDISKPDGVFGRKSRIGLETIDRLPDDIVTVYKVLMISNMKTHYARLVKSNPEKYLTYLVGWMNRMDHLELV